MTRGLPSVICLMLAGCLSNDDIPAPKIASVTPEHATPGTVVTIDGMHFCQQPHSENADEDPFACRQMGSVQFDSVPATVGLYSDMRLMLEVPQLDPGEVRVSVVVSGRVSNVIAFTID